MNYKHFFFACALNLFYYVPNLLGSPIVGGEEDTFHTYKYHVSIEQKYNPRIPNSGKHFCGGTIVHDRYVLSAAHCFLRDKPEQIMFPRRNGIVVLSGTSETHGPGIITPVDKIFISHEYNRGLHRYADISVLKLSVDLDVEPNSDRLQILPIDLENQPLDFFANKNALIVGNGCDTFLDGHVVQKLANRRQVLNVQIAPRNVCPEYHYAICAYALNHDASSFRSCTKGDSGSPIVFDNSVIGVVSVGTQNCGRNIIVCTPVSMFINFILNAMNEHADHSQMYILEN